MNGCSNYLVNFVLQARLTCCKHKGLLNMPKGKGTRKAQLWVEKPKVSSSCTHESPETIADRLSRVGVADATCQSVGFPTSPPQLRHENHNVPQATWKPKSYTTVSKATIAEAPTTDNAQSTNRDLERSPDTSGPSRLLQGPVGANFNVDKRTYARAQIRATFYPKFENEKSDQEVRTRMIEMVSHGLATLEVSLKHSGSLFMYAGHEGGAYAKNSFGNVYTAVGVFVLGQTFVEAWGTEGRKKQAEFNDFLEKNKMCISMELVTAVLGDHGQRPLQDYVVVTAVTELGNGKPKFYSTPEIIAFCRRWRLPTNHVWLFSTRKSVASFFAAYDALCEEGTATPVCRALDEVADISVPGTKDHVEVQGEILEGLVARIVSPDSAKHMEEVLKGFSSPCDEVNVVKGLSLREICAANRSEEKQQIKALLENVGTAMCPKDVDWFGDIKCGTHSRNADKSVLSKFLQAPAADFSTAKLQEVIRLMRQRHFSAAFKCYPNYHKANLLSTDNLDFKMVIHVYNDSVFRRYQQEMRRNKGLWPLYRGFFVDVNLFKENKDNTTELLQESKAVFNHLNGISTSDSDGLADEDANLMIKLKFLTYKLRTFLIRNGLPILFKDGTSAYKAYYLRQMRNWGTSAVKQRELTKMLDEWAVYITRKYGKKQLSGSSYLTEAEPFLEQFAKRSPQNQALVGSAGNLIRTEEFMAIVEGGRDEEGDLVHEGTPTSSKTPLAPEIPPKQEGLIVFFPGIPGCAKSALCRELLNSPGGLGDDRPLHSMMGDLIKGRYWQKVAEERRRKPYTITLADKNAPNEEVWKQIEDMCRSTRASAVPVIPDSEGTSSNPFSLDALAVFIYRVLQRENHPGNLDKSSPNAGYVLLMFYHLYEGKNRREFETELQERFGSVIRMPLLKVDRKPLPDPLKVILEEGINLFRLHSSKHGSRTEPSKGSYAKNWIQWERRLREVILGHAEYINSIQVPFETAVTEVREQLKAVGKGDFTPPVATKRKFGDIVFAAVTLPVEEIHGFLDKLASKNAEAECFLEDKDMRNTLYKAHITLAHKRSHGVANVARFGVYLNQSVPVELTALLFSDKMAAFEVRMGSVDGEQISSMNEWPHATIWTEGLAAKEANKLPQLVSEGKATRIDLKPPFQLSGVLVFY